MDPYKDGMFQSNPYCSKTDVLGKLVVVLRSQYEKRGLSLIPQPSRCIRRHEIHELIVCDEKDIGPGKNADRIAYLGFVEISDGGVILVGDQVYCGTKYLGTIAGYDETHMPNHINIVIFNPERRSGEDVPLKLNETVVFRSQI